MTARLLLTTLVVAVVVSQSPGALAADGPTVAFVAPWGSGGAMLARRGGDESNPEGPMSFAVARDGRLYVLDHASRRVAVFATDGRLSREFQIPATTFQDIDLGPGGEVVLLDRLVRKSLLVLGPDGGRRGEYPTGGPGIPEGGAVTALLLRPDGAWLEVLHERSVRVLGPDLKPCTRVEVPGRPASAGGGAGHVEAGLDRDSGGVLVEAVRGGHATTRATLRADLPVDRIVWVEEDGSGRTVVLVEVRNRGEGAVATPVRGFVLGPDLRVVSTLASPWGAVEWEQLREFRVTPDGVVWQMAFRPEGVAFLRWRLQ